MILGVKAKDAYAGKIVRYKALALKSEKKQLAGKVRRSPAHSLPSQPAVS